MAAKSSLFTGFDPPSLGQPHPVYHKAMVIRLSDTVNQINIAGQIATVDGVTPDTLPEQIDSVLANLTACLDAAAATVHDLTRITYHFTEEAWAQEGVLQMLVDKAAVWLQGHKPPSTLLVVKALASPEYMCEFEAQAVVTAKNG